jgi:hypothetical protein
LQDVGICGISGTAATSTGGIPSLLVPISRDLLKTLSLLANTVMDLRVKVSVFWEVKVTLLLIYVTRSRESLLPVSAEENM